MIDEALEQFWDDLESGEVYIRDKWQFALKSEFFPHTGRKKHQYIQEFYLFVPNSLQINRSTYSKNQFYLDETNLIRYKTPEFSFETLFDLSCAFSPLARILFLCEQMDTPDRREELSSELKLLANIVRSTLRQSVKDLLAELNAKRAGKASSFELKAKQLSADLKRLKALFKEAQHQYLRHWKDPLFYRQMIYTEEFINDAITHYVSGLLESLRYTHCEDISSIDQELSEILIAEQRLNDLLNSSEALKSGKIPAREGEAIPYRTSLLNKFVLDVLHLATNRYSLDQRYQHFIGGLSAGIAMLLYFSFYIWLGNVFVINSFPFILLMVITYILKDRIKEWLRILSYQQASRWFPDFTTVIKSPDDKNDLGKLLEFVSFIDPSQLSQEIKNVRNAEFHTVLESFQRPESILFYKRIVEINPRRKTQDARLFGLNIIFRFNIHRFLRKANDPIEAHLVIDPTTHQLLNVRLPKVYHLNLIIRSTSLDPTKKDAVVELKKLRLIIDKNGIKRIEQVSRE